jgi:DNA-binding Lrp family transcriptional regulator|tara:strand:- start:302 stop:565 length:264 start_codon:yes stop_codon:yes gene_type:complete
VPTAYVLINSDLGTDESIISKIKEILEDEKDIEFTTQGVYGIYDIVLKISSDDTDILRNVITYKIRKINKVQSTLTMMVIEEQEKSG